MPAPARQLASSDRGLVLLVQMAGVQCAALADALIAAGYNVQVASGLSPTVASLARRPPALVVVDGHADEVAYQTLRRAGAFAILALMAEPTDEQILAAFAAGVDDCQKSGIGQGEIIARVHNMLCAAGRQPAVRSQV